MGKRHHSLTLPMQTTDACLSVSARRGSNFSTLSGKGSGKMLHSYRDLQQACHQDFIKHHMNSTFKLASLITEFASRFTCVYDNLASELGGLVDSYRRKSAELSKDIEGTAYEQSSLRTAWETLLQEIVSDVQSYKDFAAKVNISVHERLLELVTCKKMHMREMFNFRENLDTMVDNTEESLHKLRVELRQECHSYDNYRQNYSTSRSTHNKEKAFANCVSAHNEYIMELNSANKLIQEYHSTALPGVLEELEEIHVDTCATVSNSIQTLSLLTASKARDKWQRYEGLFTVCKQVNPSADMAAFAKLIKPQSNGSVNKCPQYEQHSFLPVLAHPATPECLLKPDMILDKTAESSIKAKLRCLSKERVELEQFIRQTDERILSLKNAQQRSKMDNNFTKFYELQSEQCKLKNELNISKLRLAMIKIQIGTLSTKNTTTTSKDDMEAPANSKPEKKSTIKAMWKKFAHKASAHKKSHPVEKHSDNSSETTTDAHEDDATITNDESVEDHDKEEVDSVMSKKNGDGDSSGVSSMRSLPRQNTASSGKSGSSRSSSPGIVQGASRLVGGRPRQMLNQRMKSFSLDAPDSPRQVDSNTKIKSTSYTNNTCIPGVGASPAHAKRRMKLAAQNRGLSADIDDLASPNSSSQSLQSYQSGLRVRQQQKPPTEGDYFVALYDFTPKEQGDLSLRAGDRIQLKDSSEGNWWLGVNADGQSGYFPPRYVTSLAQGQRVLQAVKPLHLTDGPNEVKLLRDQVVVQLDRAEEHGMIIIQTNNIKSGKMYTLPCPARYLTEI